MPDPFESLHSPVAPVDPDPAFAARLRARVARAFTLPKGVTVSDVTLDPAPPASIGRPASSGVIPYVIVADARRAIDWYIAVLGARPAGNPLVMDDGRVGHAELVFGVDALYLADSPAPSAATDVAAPDPAAPATVSLLVEVADVDRTLRAATDADATVERAAADNPYGRNAVIRDPFGHRWIVSAEAPAPATGAAPSTASRPMAGAEDVPLQHGDVGYVSLWVPDVERAAAFFGHVLGWRFNPGSAAQGRQVLDSSPHHGLWGGQPRSTLFLCYAVDDVDAAVRHIRDAGGEAEAPTEEPYGRVATCADDQGTPFAVFAPPGTDAPGPGPALHGARPGDIAYITAEVADSARTRAFYGSLLGWRFTPGHVDDGWQVEGVRPMMGLHGGQDPAVAVPMYRVDDAEAAAARVRAAGGTATEPERQPYGTTAQCVDDQGTRFYLGEL